MLGRPVFLHIGFMAIRVIDEEGVQSTVYTVLGIEGTPINTCMGDSTIVVGYPQFPFILYDCNP